jgi:hypothetical protein
LEPLLRARGVDKFTSKITVSYGDRDREHLLAKMADLRKANVEFVRTFNLTRSIVDEDQIVKAGLVNLWTILIDSKSNAMRGYGDLQVGIASQVDARVDELLRIIDELL